MRRPSLIASAVVIALTLIAAPFSGAMAREDRPLRIGVLTDLTGSLYPYGMAFDNGFALGIAYATGNTSQAAGRPVEVMIRDYADDTALAAAQARDLIEIEGAEILIGAPSSAATLGLIDIAAEYGVILMAGPAADPRITGEFFKPPLSARVPMRTRQLSPWLRGPSRMSAPIMFSLPRSTPSGTGESPLSITCLR